MSRLSAGSIAAWVCALPACASAEWRGGGGAGGTSTPPGSATPPSQRPPPGRRAAQHEGDKRRRYRDAAAPPGKVDCREAAAPLPDKMLEDHRRGDDQHKGARDAAGETQREERRGIVREPHRRGG